MKTSQIAIGDLVSLALRPVAVRIRSRMLKKELRSCELDIALAEQTIANELAVVAARQAQQAICRSELRALGVKP